MLSFKINVLCLLILNTFVGTTSLVELSTEDICITATESIIRNTINELFSILRLRRAKFKPRLKQFSTIHNFFVSLTLRDHRTLNEIVEITRERYDNTTIVTAILKELFNEDNVNDEGNDESVTRHVESFLNVIRKMKETFKVNNQFENVMINKDIWNILNTENNFNITNDNDTRNYRNDDTNNVLSDIEIWQENGRRIYRGENTKAKYFPFMASIQFFKKFQCGGSIIKSDLVITAASCLQLVYNNRFFRENPAFLSVRVGSRFYEGGGEDIPVLEVYFHPTYDPKNLRNNIALMRLIRRLNLGKKKSKNVKKIDIDKNASQLPENTEGITIIGWGAKKSSNLLADPWHNRLSFAVLDFYPLRECQEVYSKEYVRKTNFCAGFFSKGGGACNRDVGGPGVVNGLLTGVVSFGSPVCGAIDAPTVFTKVGYYKNWIENIMEQDVPNTKRGTTLKTKRTHSTTPPYHENIQTTFKMKPIVGKNPKSAEDKETTGPLRINDESDLFNKFLSIMFENKEITEYIDSVDSFRQNVKNNKELSRSPEDLTGITTMVPDEATISKQIEPVTKLDIYDVSQETGTRSTVKYTVLNENVMSSVENSLEKRMVDLFDNINVAKLVNETKLENEVRKPINKNDYRNQQRLSNGVKKIDDSILTLLYLTDNEKNTEDHENYGSESNEGEGLSIPTDTFKDMTYINEDSFDLKSRNNLLSLLSDAIKHSNETVMN